MVPRNIINSNKRIQSSSRVKSLISFTALTLLFSPLTAYAMDLPDAESQYEQGKQCGIFEVSQARKHYKLAAKQGHAKAQFKVAEIEYDAGSRAKAFKNYKRAAKHLIRTDGDFYEPNMLGRAQFRLGELYYNGDLAAKNLDKAYKYYALAKANGYDVGPWVEVIGDERDYAAYSSLAEQGNLEAQIKMGKMFARGRYVIDDYELLRHKDIRKALEYLTSAADQGHPESHYHLGNLYEEGGSTSYITNDGSIFFASGENALNYSQILKPRLSITTRLLISKIQRHNGY